MSWNKIFVFALLSAASFAYSARGISAATLYDESVSGDLNPSTPNFFVDSPDLGTLSIGLLSELKGSMIAASTGGGDQDSFFLTIPAGTTLSATLDVTNYQAALGSGGFVSSQFGTILFNPSPPTPLTSFGIPSNGSASLTVPIGPYSVDTKLLFLVAPAQRQFGNFPNVTVNGTGGGNWNLALTVTPVPEPRTIALAGIGLIGLAIAARRRK